MKNNHQKLKTPCIGVCSTGLGDSVCRGCKRYAHEIIDWNRYSIAERRIVLSRIEKLLVEIVRAKVSIFDATRLKAFLETHKIDFNPEASAYCWVFDVLKAGASQVSDLTVIGVKKRHSIPVDLNAIGHNNKDNQSIALRDEIDREFYDLSCAHYQRYFQRYI